MPEVFYSMSDGITPTPYLVEEGNEHYKEIQKLSTDFGMAQIGGSAATLLNGKVVNRAYNFDKNGKDLGHYDKINLFACDLPDKKISEATANGLSSGLASTSNGVASSVGNATGKAVGQGLGMGLGIGLVYGISGSIYQKLTENDVFVLTKDYTDINGNKSRVVALFYAKSFNDKAIIKNLLIENINKKINKG